MSAETVETVLALVISDTDFAEALFKNAENALAGYDLTPEEIENIKNMSREGLGESKMNLLEERKSMGVFDPNPTTHGPH
jgi:hypothetical protein